MAVLRPWVPATLTEKPLKQKGALSAYDFPKITESVSSYIVWRDPVIDLLVFFHEDFCLCGNAVSHLAHKPLLQCLRARHVRKLEADEAGIFQEQLEVCLCQGSQHPLLFGMRQTDVRGCQNRGRKER